MNRLKTMTQRKSVFKIATLILSLALVCLLFMGMAPFSRADISALSLGLSESTETVTITIEKPYGWKTKETPIPIKVESNILIAKVEAKLSNYGSFVNITDDMKVDISENCTVYVQVTDAGGNLYTKSRYLEIFDRETPTVKANITKSLLHVEANDTLSGIYGIYVDDEMYTDLTNDTLDVRVRDIGKTYDEISIQAVDMAGNKSKVVTVKNPNYKEKTDDKKEDKPADTQASTTQEKPDGTGTTANVGTQNGTATATNTTVPAVPATTQPQNTASTANTGGTNPTAENSAKASGGGDSSEAPLFGTFQDTNKQFMTIVSKDGAVYYLIIDHDKESENVYLLSEVTNAELASFTPQGMQLEEKEDYPEFIGDKPKDDEQIRFVDEPDTEKEADGPDTDTEEQQENEKPEEQPKGGSAGTAILLVLVILGFGGAGYYFKVHKPKQEMDSADDLDDFEFAEDDEYFDFDSLNNQDSADGD